MSRRCSAGSWPIGGLGLGLMAAGYALLVRPSLTLFGLLLVIFAIGCFKGNMTATIGRAAVAARIERERSYRWMLVALNIGALAALLLYGGAAWRWGWSAAFVIMIGARRPGY